MKKGIYFTSIDIIEPSVGDTGIGRKIKRQIESFEKAGLSVDIRIVKKMFTNGVINSVVSRIPFSPFGYYRWTIDFEIDDLDFIYIRKSLIDYSFYRFVRRIRHKKKDIKIILEIPTYPYDKESIGRLDKTFIAKDKIWRCFLRKYINRIVTFSDDNYIFGIKTIRTSNGIEPRKCVKDRERDENVINFVAVAQLMPWHGYDRVIEGLRIYYKENNKAKNIIFYIVGDGPEYGKLSALVSKYALSDHVVLTGRKTGTDLEKIYEIADVCIDSLGRHRVGVKYNSSLKGKEYLAFGIPIVSGVKTELDDDPSFPYYFRVDATDNPIEIERIIDFLDLAYRKGEKHKSLVHEEINQYCMERFTHKIVWNSVIQYILGSDLA